MSSASTEMLQPRATANPTAPAPSTDMKTKPYMPKALLTNLVPGTNGGLVNKGPRAITIKRKQREGNEHGKAKRQSRP